MRKLVVDLHSRSKAFWLPDEIAAQIAANVPGGWQLHVVASETNSFGDGALKPSDESLREIGNAEVYFGYGMPKALFAEAQQLKWVHTATAGVASLLFPEMVSSEVILSNSAGVYGPAIAEHVLGGTIHFLRAFDLAGELQRRGEWNSSIFDSPAAGIREVSECNVLVVGARGIGAEVATRFNALGARVVGLRRSPARGVPPGFARIEGLDAMDAELPLADVVVLAAPLTSDTNMVLNARRIAMLKTGAIVCNVSRGALLDEVALAAALADGRVRGAVLDVFLNEPLAAESPLWHLPNVLQTPHVSGVSPRKFWERLVELFLDNWSRYRAGAPMRNVVDRHLGY